MKQPIQLAIITNDILIQTTIETFLNDNYNLHINFMANSGDVFLKAIAVTRNPQVDILLLDMGKKGLSKLEDIVHIQKILPKVNIIIINAEEEDERIFKALYAGAVSCLSKRTPITKIEEAITTTYYGGSYISPSIARTVLNYFSAKKTSQKTTLTSRQKQIIDGVVDGLSYKMIADKLFISIDTVRHHIKNIYRLLNINSKAELIKLSYEQDLLAA